MSAAPTPSSAPRAPQRVAPSWAKRAWLWLRHSLSWKLQLGLMWVLVLGLGIGVACLFTLTVRAISVAALIWLLVGVIGLGVVTRLAKRTIAVLVAGIVMNAAYLSYTAYGERNFDVSHQVKYVRYMVEHGVAPPDAYCFICHHPPLFYGTSAIMHQIGAAMHFPDPMRAAQAVSFLSVVLMALSAAYLTRRFTSSVPAINLATALMVFWPYSLVMSGRIHNDSLASGLMVAGTYACVRWFQDKDAKSLILAAVLCGLSVWTKTNGYVLVILLFCASALVWWRSPQKAQLVRRKAPILLALVLALGTYASNRGSARQYEKDEEAEKKKEQEKKAKAGQAAAGGPAPKDAAPQDNAKPAAEGKDKEDDAAVLKPLSPEERAKLEVENENLSLAERLLGSAGKIGARSWMGNEPFNYLYFDLEGFLKHPYVLARHDGSGRQYFWNHVIKSSLFSTHNHRPDYETSYRLNRVLAGVINGLLLAMLVFMIISLPKVRRKHEWTYAVLVLAGLGFLGGGAAFRILIPHSHHSDFRHMFPVLLPAVVAYALMVDAWRQEGRALHWVGQGLALAMIVGTVVYYAPKHQWVMAHTAQRYVVKETQDLSRYAKAESKWNEHQYVVLEPNERLWMNVKGAPTAYGISIATDHNDIYEVRVIGQQEVRVFDVGLKKAAGIAIFNEHLVPPVQGVRAIEVRPRGGDVHYSVGHLILNPHGYNRPYIAPSPKPEAEPSGATQADKDKAPGAVPPKPAVFKATKKPAKK